LLALDIKLQRGHCLTHIGREGWLKRKEVGARLSLSEESVRRLTRAGVLRAFPAGKRAIRYLESDVAKLISQGVAR
jgi:hypothetical protein